MAYVEFTIMCNMGMTHYFSTTELCFTEILCDPTFTDKKVSQPNGHKKLKVLREFHWQSFWSTRLTKMSQWLHLNNSHAYPFCKTMPGTISESCQQSCAIESQQQFFRCSNCDRIFVSETRSKWSRNYSVSVSEGSPEIFVNQY